MMCITTRIAVSAAGLIWCMTASAQQSVDMITGAEATGNPMINKIELPSLSGAMRPTPDNSRPAIAPSTPDFTTSRQAWLIAPEDKTLQSTISAWSAAAGWQLQWDLPVDYPIEIHASIFGSFEEAIETITTTMEKSDFPMKAIFFMGNKVLRIVAKGSE